MAWRFFNGVTSQQQAREVYHQLAKEHHPDRGGDSETMTALNREWNEVKKMSDSKLQARAGKTNRHTAQRSKPINAKHGKSTHHAQSYTVDQNAYHAPPKAQRTKAEQWAEWVAENYPGHDPLYFTEADFWADKVL